MSCACSQEVTACFILASVVYRTPVTGPYAVNGTHDWLRLGGNGHPYQQTSLTNTWLTSDLQNTPTSSKLSPPGYRHLTPIYSTPIYKPWCHGGTNASMSIVTRWRCYVYHLLPMCHAYVEVIKALGVRLSVTLFFKLPCKWHLACFT